MSTKNIFKNLSKSNKIFIIAEAGSNHLRNLKRAFQTIIGKLNIIRITQKSSLDNLDLPFKLDNFELPMNINEDIVKKLVESDKLDSMNPPEFMYT